MFMDSKQEIPVDNVNADVIELKPTQKTGWKNGL